MRFGGPHEARPPQATCPDALGDEAFDARTAAIGDPEVRRLLVLAGFAERLFGALRQAVHFAGALLGFRTLAAHRTGQAILDGFDEGLEGIKLFWGDQAKPVRRPEMRQSIPISLGARREGSPLQQPCTVQRRSFPRLPIRSVRLDRRTGGRLGQDDMGLAGRWCLPR